MNKGWTKFPNFLLDEVLPKLRDTELRIIAIVVRETIGRSDPAGGRQKRAWLTQEMLKKRTGRQSAAISRAIDVLCQSGLIEVCDFLGRPLLTSRSRRFYRGRIRFSLNPSLLGEDSQMRSSKSEW